MIIEEEDYLAHYGILRRSGRYPWGSGGNSSSTTRHRDFLKMCDDLKKSGMSDVEIAKGVFGEHGTTTQLRAAKSIAKAQQKQADITRAQQLKNLGHSNSSIGREMGINESSVRALLAPGQKDKADVLDATKAALKEQVAQKKYVDVGVGTEYHLSAAQGMHISDNKLRVAVAALEQEGYSVHNIKVPQLGTGKQTTVKVLAAPGTTFGEVSKNRYQIKSVTAVSDDGGRSFYGHLPPISVRSSRIAVRYADQGGKDADGVIYVRPGVKDLSLGGNQYAQVRIMVDGTHFLKGMAVYKDDLPDGVDLEFNTSKHDTGHKHDAMKPLSGDPDNPFGATFHQITVPDKHGARKVTSAMNIVNDEGDWERWSKTLSSQFLSKQSPKLAKSQLDMLADNKQREFDEIMALNNPAVKRRLLQSFADDADSAAVHLKAAHLPRQKTHVIMPVSSMKDTEVYAPNFNNGERVVLIRHPHAGTFEIPELTVNNRNPQARKLLGTHPPNAIGINARVAQHLSGADFDGDTVIVIPNPHGHVKTTPALADLKGFDPMLYKLPKDSPIPRITGPRKQQEMGSVSNLITDMTIHGASHAEIARAVRHSMVVIDAEKHELNYKQSEQDNGIKQLKAKYQGRSDAGAATLISRAKSEIRVPDRRERSASEGGRFDKKTGKLVFVPTGATTLTKDGRVVPKLIKSTKLAETDNAHTLVSSTGTPIEKIYADHSNKLKDMANRARVELGQTSRAKYSPSAKTAYAKEVQSLNAKLNLALRNAPLERNAQVLANAILQQKKQANPNMEPAHVKRIKSQALDEARRRLGAKKDQIEITGPEWEAIQAGAISDHKLNQILENADLKKIKTLATPRTVLKMTPAKLQRAQSMLASGYTQAEIAAHLGVGLTTLKVALKEG